MSQTLLFDTRIAILKEDKNGYYDVLNSDKIKTKESLNLVHSGMSKDREDFENEIKKCYGVKQVKWIN